MVGITMWNSFSSVAYSATVWVVWTSGDLKVNVVLPRENFSVFSIPILLIEGITTLKFEVVFLFTTYAFKSRICHLVFPLF